MVRLGLDYLVRQQMTDQRGGPMVPQAARMHGTHRRAIGFAMAVRTRSILSILAYDPKLDDM
jgi:hypothetical protein